MDNIDYKELSSLELLELYKRINAFIDGDDINA